MLEVKNLVKSFNKKTNAVDGVTFNVREGEISVLLGPNGAGKSTTIKSIAGLLRFSGQIQMTGYSNQTMEAKRIFSYIPESPSIYELLTVDEHMEFMAKAYKLDDYEGLKEALLERFDLKEHRDKAGKELSKGMQQKVSICCGLLTNPKVILFDEPMIGLDPKAINELKKTFIELKQSGCSVLVSTHIIDSIDELWDRVLIMNRGKIVMDLTRDHLEEQKDTLENLFFKVTEQEV